jgi:hypothetical protein
MAVPQHLRGLFVALTEWFALRAGMWLAMVASVPA